MIRFPQSQSLQPGIRETLTAGCDISQVIAEKGSIRRLQWATVKSFGIHDSRRKSGKANIKTGKDCDRTRGKKSPIDRVWLARLSFKVAASSKNSEYNNNIINNINIRINKHEMSIEQQRTENKFPNIFKRQGKIVVHTIKIEFNEGTKATQQNGRVVALQLQEAVDEEIKNSLAAGQIGRIDKITDELFTNGNYKRNNGLC